MSHETHIGRYRLGRRIGVGGMAEVYLATLCGPEGFEREVVVKRIRPDLACDEALHEMFMDEARLSATLHHPNIVQVIDCGRHDGVPFLVMEYVDGVTVRELGQALPAAGSRRARVGLRILRDLASALEHAHARTDRKGAPTGIVHRDVSPTNVLVSTAGEVKLTDFGIAKVHARLRSSTLPGLVRGTPAYLAPEQCRGARVDARTDMYAAGLVAFELVTGERFLRGKDREEIMAAASTPVWRDPSKINRDTPEAFVAILRRALAPEPEDRFLTMTELCSSIDECVEGTGLVDRGELASLVRATMAVRAGGRASALAIPSMISATRTLDLEPPTLAEQRTIADAPMDAALAMPVVDAFPKDGVPDRDPTHDLDVRRRTLVFTPPPDLLPKPLDPAATTFNMRRTGNPPAVEAQFAAGATPTKIVASLRSTHSSRTLRNVAIGSFLGLLLVLAGSKLLFGPNAKLSPGGANIVVDLEGAVTPPPLHQPGGSKETTAREMAVESASIARAPVPVLDAQEAEITAKPVPLPPVRARSSSRKRDLPSAPEGAAEDVPSRDAVDAEIAAAGRVMRQRGLRAGDVPSADARLEEAVAARQKDSLAAALGLATEAMAAYSGAKIDRNFIDAKLKRLRARIEKSSAIAASEEHRDRRKGYEARTAHSIFSGNFEQANRELNAYDEWLEGVAAVGAQ